MENWMSFFYGWEEVSNFITVLLTLISMIYIIIKVSKEPNKIITKTHTNSKGITTVVYRTTLHRMFKDKIGIIILLLSTLIMVAHQAAILLMSNLYFIVEIISVIFTLARILSLKIIFQCIHEMTDSNEKTNCSHQ